MLLSDLFLEQQCVVAELCIALDCRVGLKHFDANFLSMCGNNIDREIDRTRVSKLQPCPCGTRIPDPATCEASDGDRAHCWH